MQKQKNGVYINLSSFTVTIHCRNSLFTVNRITFLRRSVYLVRRNLHKEHNIPCITLCMCHTACIVS